MENKFSLKKFSDRNYTRRRMDVEGKEIMTDYACYLTFPAFIRARLFFLSFRRDLCLFFRSRPTREAGRFAGISAEASHMCARARHTK